MIPNRTIPTIIRRQLRREVNWGCPVANCGSPFLSYHHFAPPFRKFTDQTKHALSGIIALCMAHAAQADGGVFSDEQIRELKKNPFLRGGQVSGKNQWLRRNTILRSGSNIFISIGTLLTVCGEKVISFNRNLEGYLELSMNIKDSNGNPLFVMENNDWLVSGSLDDLQVTPRGRDIVIKSKTEGFWITLQFNDLSVDALRSEIEDLMVARERERVERTNAMNAQIRAGLPDEIKKLMEEIPWNEKETRRKVWGPFEQNIRGDQVLEIILKGHLPPPVEVFASDKETKIGGIEMTGTIAIGPASIFSFGL